MTIELTPGFIYGGNNTDGVGTYHLNVQTQTPITGAILAEVRFDNGGRVSRGAFTASAKQQTISFEISRTEIDNLITNNHLTIGTTEPMHLRLLATGDREILRRPLNVPVIAKPATAPDVDQTARNLAGAAQTRADQALSAAQTAQTRAEAPGPVTIVSNIASYDATQNRFEDSSGNEVVVPNGSIVTLLQTVYDAAVTDSDFTPNANAIFLTR